MHFSTFTVSAALAGLVSAQSSLTLPACAAPCVSLLLPASCNSNPQCICTNTGFINNIACCVYEACTAADQETALNYAKTLCTPVGATLPSSASCAAGAQTSFSGISTQAGAATGSAVSGSAASTVTGAASSAASSASSSAASATSHASGEKLTAHGMGLFGAVLGAVALL